MFSYRIDDQLELKLFEPHQANTVFALCDRNRDHLRPWLPWIETTLSAEDSLAYITNMKSLYGAGTDVATGIWFEGEYAGAIGLHRINQANKSAEIGYWLSADQQGKGIMTRACRTMIDYAFNTLNLNRIEIHVDPRNTPSRAIPERLGCTNEGTLRQCQKHYDGFIDLVIYGILKSEWEQE